MTWWLGVFKDNANTLGFGVGDGEYATTGRVTFLPWYECDGARFLHLGAGASHRSLDDHRVRLRSRPGVRGTPSALTPVLADTEFIGAEEQDLFDLEFALALGPWTLQSEYYGAFVRDAVYPNVPSGTPRGTIFYHGAYAEVLYFLTGEHREYNRKIGNYDRIVPYHQFCIIKGDDGWCGGWGGWQVGVRYSYLDLSDSGINGGILHDLTLGLSWYLNANTKFQWNYFITRRTDVTASPDGTVQGFGMRMHYDF
jgi:phosphate-selective porin OprO/OprP